MIFQMFVFVINALFNKYQRKNVAFSINISSILDNLIFVTVAYFCKMHIDIRHEVLLKVIKKR